MSARVSACTTSAMNSLADLDVLRVLLRRGGVVGVDERELRQLPGRGVGQELGEVVLTVGARRGRRTGHDQEARKVLVVDTPADLVRVEPIPDRAVLGGNLERRVVGGDRPRRRPGEEEAAVRVRLREHGAEVPLAEREVLRERVREGDVRIVPVAHRDRAAGADEAVVATVVIGDVARVPCLRGLAIELARRHRGLRVNLCPCVSRLKFRSLPCLRVKPSTSSRPVTRNGTAPSRLSNEWFSIISTTMWSIFGIDGVPAGR